MGGDAICREHGAVTLPASLRAVPARMGSGLFRPEWVFLALAIVFGSACLFLTPPCQVPDEASHFDRAFQLSEGRVVPLKRDNQTGDHLPRNVAHLRQIFERLERHPEQKTSRAEIGSAMALAIDGDRVFTNFPNTAVHPPLAYLPQALGIAVARVFSPSVLIGFYAGRLCNLLAATALFFLAVRVAPVGKWAFVVLALTPMSVFETASLSSDALTNAFSFLLIAYVLRCACGPAQRLGARDVALLALLVIALGLVKQGYLLLVLAYFLIPAAKLGGRRRYGGVFALLAGCELLTAGAWALVVRNVYSPVLPGIDPRAQLAYDCAHPMDLLRAVLRTSTVEAPGTGWEYVGFLGILDTPLPGWLVLAEAGLLLAVSCTAFRPGDITARQALVALGTAALTYLSILFVIHLTWDPVGPTRAIGVQGRYFIPLGPLVALGISPVGGIVPSLTTRLRYLTPSLVALSAPLLLAATLAELHQRYFVDDAAARAERQFDEGQKLLKAGASDKAVEHFREAVRLDPGHVRSHFNLGVLLARVRPLEAIEHYRTAARLAPNDAHVRNNLGNALARQGLFEEAIRHYEAALHVAPDDKDVQRNLQQAIRSRDLLASSLSRIASAIQARALDGMTEERYDNTDRGGFYLKANRGEIRTREGSPLFPEVRYLWRCPPPSGDPIRLLDRRGEPVRQPRRTPFYACAAYLIGPRRIFVFPPPVGAVLLADQEVSWLYQVRLDALTEDEQAREEEYRAREGLHFPLPLRPERPPGNGE
jgi:uncharacterized membrane protein